MRNTKQIRVPILEEWITIIEKDVKKGFKTIKKDIKK